MRPTTTTPFDLARPETLQELRVGDRLYYIHRCPVGRYLAGSGTRWQDRETFLAGCAFPDGTTHGGHFRTLTEAQATYDRATLAYTQRLAEDHADYTQ